eukprot:3643125-Prymnesium_polylepis.1
MLLCCFNASSVEAPVVLACQCSGECDTCCPKGPSPVMAPERVRYATQARNLHDPTPSPGMMLQVRLVTPRDTSSTVSRASTR